MSTTSIPFKRTHDNSSLRLSDTGRDVVLMGWVHNRRDHGGRVFIDLRDRSGLTQVMFGPDIGAEAHALAGELRGEYCIAVAGKVVSRISSGGQPNPKLATGEIEVEATRLHIFSRAEPTPFPIEDQIETNEQLRLKYRYLDLRRPALQRNFITRSKIYQAARGYFHGEGFLELETPFMVKYTPGGARNFLVPSRLNPGHFYALAESPQIFKQLFMVAGFERYFQIVRCFRDEDLRQDRQPEFTQIDVEMSFIDEEDIHRTMEGLVVALWRETLGVELPRPFPRLSYEEAMRRYGVDKPDLRFGLPLDEVTAEVASCGFRVFEQAVAGKGIVKALRVPKEDAKEVLSRSFLDSLTDLVKPTGAKGVAFARVQEGGGWQAPFAKNFTDEARGAVNAKLGAEAGDVLLFVADKAKIANVAMGQLRLHVGAKLGLIDRGAWRFLWVTDFPLFEQNEQGRWVAAHHPFTSPHAEDLEHIGSDNGRVRARAYDLVLNGNEIAGGSIRIFQRDVQARVLSALGLSVDDLQAKFGFLLDAFRYGPPPHGGIAFGLDRLAMLITGADSLRDVVAFPKTQKGTDLMSDAPTEVTDDQLKELFVRIQL